MPDLIELRRVCGMIDAPYIARYRSDDNGGLLLVEVVGVDWQAPHALTDEETDGTGEKCPWCGSVGELVYCPRCESWICSSSRIARNKDGRDFFLCRSSCRNRA